MPSDAMRTVERMFVDERVKTTGAATAIQRPQHAISSSGVGATDPLSAVDLFCGAGGLSQGLVDAGFELLAAADHDPDACATYRHNFPAATLVEGDLTSPARHEELLAAVSSVSVDLLAGGPPCQAYSQVRNHDRLIEDPRNRLYREFVSLLGELQPRALMLENVLGMNQLNGGAVRRQIEQDLSLDGDYNVISGVLDAGDFGTPQRRPRLVFIGVRAELGTPGLPDGTGISRALRNGHSGQPAQALFHVDRRLHDMLVDPANARVVTVRQGLSDLIEPGDAYSSDPQSAYQRAIRKGSAAPQDHTPSRIRDDTRLRLEAIPPGGNVYDLPNHLLKRYLGDEKWGPAGNGERLARRHYYAYRRLHPDWLAWTANTKADFAYHYEVPRGLSVREAARIQGFPDRFHFVTAAPGTPGQLKNGARHSRYRQVGNAVPPPLAAAIGRAVADQLGRSRASALAATKSG
jgi:DNA (cytosine-5)-methyltransferase 1